MARKLSQDALLILAALPKEPIAHSIPDLAEDLFGHTDSKTLGRVKRGLAEMQDILYVEIINTRPYGHKDAYGIKGIMWTKVRKLLTLPSNQR